MEAVPKDFPINLCMKHLRLAGEFYVEVKDVLRFNTRRAQPETRTVHRVVRKEAPDSPEYPGQSRDTGLVYYILFGDRIKIGYTKNITERMSVLPWEEVLALEPGSFALENSRHKKFDKYKLSVKREWFSDCKPLRDHIAGLREQWPHLTRLAMKFNSGEKLGEAAPMEDPPIPHDMLTTFSSGMQVRNFDRVETHVQENTSRKFAGARFQYDGE